ncbi:hypothetical protein EV426DRAFT_308323 [Tirmania nivea]|nr:hypothetical protein EV426DRAFT_308323 [Tirmania nivea]
MHSRHHSLGTNPSMHRVTRRKSVSSTATNLAAVAQAVKEGTDVQLTLPPPNSSILSRSVGRSVGMGLSAGLHSSHGSLALMHGYPSPPSSLPNNGGTSPLVGAGSLPASGFTFPRKVPVPASPTPVDGGISSAAASNSVTSSPLTNRRVRRASEGAHVLLGGESSEEKVRGKGGVELKCDKCGKGYKHSSCLTKHLWEHTPEWSLTSKLLISKHQQVQLLEAASILVSMNPSPSVDDNNGNPTPAVSTASSGASINDNSSVSSGSEDTPPPTDHNSSSASVIDMESGSPMPTRVRPRSGSKRYTTSRVERPSHGVHGHGSYHHAAAPPLLAGSVPTHVNPGSSFPSHFGNRQHVTRPRAGSLVNSNRVATAAAAAADDEGLAAAVELLSCSFGAAPGSTPVTPRGMLGSPMTAPGFLHKLREQARKQNGGGDDVMKIEETEEESVYYDGGMSHRNPSQQSADDEMAIDDDDEEDEWERRRGSDGRMHTRAMRRSRRKSEEEEDGVFGRMEE